MTEGNEDESAYQLGLAASLLHNGQIEDALEHGDNALKDGISTPGAIFTFAKALFDTNQTEAAINAYGAGLALDPNNIGGQYQLALLLQSIGDQKGTVMRYRKLLQTDPDNVEALCNLSAAARDIGALHEAIQCGERALALRPEFADAHNNLGLALCAKGNATEAIPHLKAALKMEGSRYETLNNLGVAQQACGNLQDAETTLRQALNVEVSGVSAPAAERNLGNVLRQMERLDEAIAVYEKALSLNPNHTPLRKSLGIAQLLKGAFADGWHNYEARLEELQPSHSIKRWDGQTRAQTLLVQAEQGFGDTLQFCRYIPSLYESADQIIFECQPALKELMASLGGPLIIRTPEDPTVEADYYIPLLSLPMVNGTDMEAIPSATPYLHADTGLAQKWKNKLNQAPPKVGLVWSGNPSRQDDRMRSCPPENLRTILDVGGCNFVSLQKEGVPPSRAPLSDLSADLSDFSQTAAAITALDLVITVDTAVAHLAGSLGKPVWVMLGYAADWRYLLEREDCPWYPTMRLFRQTSPGDWAGVTAKLVSELQRWKLETRTQRGDQS